MELLQESVSAIKEITDEILAKVAAARGEFGADAVRGLETKRNKKRQSDLNRHL